MGRKIGAVIGGVIAVGVTVFAIQQIGAFIHPLPPGIDPMDPADRAAFTAHLATMPFAAWVIACVSEPIGAFIGALVAIRVGTESRRRLAGAVILVAFFFSVVNWVSFEHPIWFMVAQVVLYPLVFLAVSKTIPVNPYEANA